MPADPRKSRFVDRLSSDLYVACSRGALKGALVSVSTSIFLLWKYPYFRTVKTPLKIFWFVSWISMGTVFEGDKELVRFNEKVSSEEQLERQEYLNRMADLGVYIEK